MGTKRRILFIGLFLTAMGLLAWAVLSLREPADPVYGGKRLSEWLRQTPGMPFTSWFGPDTPRLYRLVTHMPEVDSNAVPYLVKMLNRRDGSAYKFYRIVYFKLPVWMQSRLAMPVRIQTLRCNAAALLACLGKDARPAVPALALVLKREDYWLIHCFAGFVLGQAGKGDPAASRVLVLALVDTNQDVRLVAAEALRIVDPTTAAKLAAEGRLTNAPVINQ